MLALTAIPTVLVLLTIHRPLLPLRPMSAPPALQFPPSFAWGTATASYQIEGASSTHRAPSIWDRFSHTPGNVVHNDTGDVACDHYHRFRDDVALIASLRASHYRFSIAWPRIQAFDDAGAASDNPDGIRFYNELIDELIAAGITPVGTLYHWDLPTAVHDGTGGWAGDGAVVQRFEEYVRVCFRGFGDRVKHWITLNEPWCSAVLGYEVGEHAPGDTSAPGVKVYRAGHNLLLAHAHAVKVYRREFAAEQGGKIGITLNSMWMAPRDAQDAGHVAAAQRAMEFELGWFADPVWKGDYPAVMRETVGERLPKFSEEEKELLKGSSDYFGINHYSSQYATGVSEPDEGKVSSYWDDKRTVTDEDAKWGRTDMGWAIVPWGMRDILLYVQKRYAPDGGIWVTENGLAVKEASVEEARGNGTRVAFYKEYVTAMHEAMQQGADVRGYFLWSLLDNFEWAFGYGKRFGLFFVDYETLERTAKPAVEWYTKLASSNRLEM